jgi:AcrR family transcriptional regulator
MPTGAGADSAKPVLTAVPGAGGTKQLILETAQRLFDEQGYDATSLRQIAEAVGMTKAAVYYHYPAKEHLLLELTRPMLDAMSELVTGMRTGAADSTTALSAYLDLLVDHLPVVLLLTRDPATQNHPDVGQRARVLVEAVQRLVAGADATTDRTVRAACALGVIHAIAILPPEVARTNRDVILEAALAALDPARITS